jgi:hypothetical protein
MGKRGGKIIGAIVGAVTFGAGSVMFGSSFLASAVTGAALGSAYDQYKAAKDMADQSNRLSSANTNSENLPLALIYGTCRYGGNVVYDSNNSSAQVEDLYVCIGICEGEIHSIRDVKFNEKPVNTYKGCDYRAYLGTSVQTADSINPDENYSNTAYIAAHIHASKSLTGNPQITCIVDGLKVLMYNNGTWYRAFSRNPVWALYDIMSNDRYGMGISATRFDIDSFIEAAAYCDELIREPDGTFAPRFTFDAIFNDPTDAEQIISAIAASFRGFVIESNGKYSVRIERPEVPIQSFVEGETIIDGSMRLYRPSLYDIPNRLIVEFTDPVHWSTDSYPIDSDSDILKRKGIYPKTLPFVGVTRRNQAIRNGQFAFNTMTKCRDFVEFRAPMDMVEAQAGDVILVTHSIPGYVDQPMRIMQLVYHDDANEIGIVARQYSTEVFVDDIVLWTPGERPTAFNPAIDPPNITNIEVSEHWRTSINNGAGVVVDLDVTWTPAYTQYYSHSDVYVSCTNPAWDEIYDTWETLNTPYDNLDAPATFRYVGKAIDKITLPNLLTGEKYTIKIVPYGTLGAVPDFDDAPLKTYTITGKTYLPDTPRGLSVLITDRCLWSFHESTQNDINFHELRTNVNPGTDDGLLLRITTPNTYGLVTPNSRTGTVFLYSHNTSDKYSNPAVLDYNKPKPIAPVLTIDKIFRGITMSTGSLPPFCIGVNFHVSNGDTDQVFFSGNNTYTYIGVGILTIRAAFVDIFGEGDMSEPTEITVIPTIDPEWIKNESLSLEMMDTVIKDAVAKAQAGVDLTQFEEMIAQRVSYTVFNENINALVQADNSNASAIQQTSESITNTVADLNMPPDQTGFNAISQLKQTADAITLTVSGNRETQDGVNTEVQSQINQTAGSVTSVVTELNKPLDQCSYTAIAQTLNNLQFRASDGTMKSLLNISPEAISIISQFIHINGDVLIDDNIIVGNMLAADSITADKMNITSLSAITATIGVLRTAATGARTEIRDNLIQVYDANNILRVRMGVW